MSRTDRNVERVVIAVDPHKASWTAAAVSASLQPLATLRVPVSLVGYRELRRFADRWPQASWAIEGAGGLGAPLTARLSEEGITVVDVPAKLAARVRLLSTGHGRKSDEADATSVGIAALSASGLRTLVIDETAIALRALVDHRDDLVKSRTQTVNRLHRLLIQLIPAGAPQRLSAKTAAELLCTVDPQTPLLRTLHALASDLISEIGRLDERITATTAEITTAVTASGTTVTQLHGIGTLLAGKILALVGSIDRFRSAAAFASYTGTAPIEASSGDVIRHRLSRAGNRQLNHCLHIMAITQLSHDTRGRAYYRDKRAAGKSHREALRCLKRRLSDAVYRRLVRDAHPDTATGPGGHSGATTKSSAAGSTPTTDSSDKSLPGPADTDPTNHTSRST
ncbi:MAG: IS110 family transposase [Actinomycetota bacterium]|nr:IS110 family transposase [Actinomycetota bacterium]